MIVPTNLVISEIHFFWNVGNQWLLTNDFFKIDSIHYQLLFYVLEETSAAQLTESANQKSSAR